MIDMEKLNAGLEKLTGHDMEQAAREERRAGSQAALLDVEKSFQARLAAKALQIPLVDIRDLPIREYNEVCNNVLIFLNRSSATEE
ncbi:MAG: hypothetical protein IJK81_03195 [Selenomonadaceae bacterium]|nr:hypothetical protein [Selenomonadaceae bacterium]